LEQEIDRVSQLKKII